MPITTSLDKIRLLIGDTDEDAILFHDEELNWFLSERADNVYLAAADACEAAARKFARAYDFETDGQSFKRSQMAKAFRELAHTLRARVTGVQSVTVTRVDGYSEDVTNRQTAAGTADGRRRYITIGGLDQLD